MTNHAWGNKAQTDARRYKPDDSDQSMNPETSKNTTFMRKETNNMARMEPLAGDKMAGQSVGQCTN